MANSSPSSWSQAQIDAHNLAVQMGLGRLKRILKEQNGNPEDSHKAPSPKPKPAVQNEPLAAPERKATYTGRVTLIVISYRQRLCDPDNLVPKYFIDGLRYAGIISDDRDSNLSLRIEQRKVGSKDQERTEIEIIP